jgi:tetratricopeptide (TPR) repeat protein
MEYLDYNEPDQALAAFSEAIRLRPHHVPAWFARGFAQASLGQFDAAIADYSEAIRLDPRYAAAYHNRSAALAAVGNQSAAQQDQAKYQQLRGGAA